MADPPRVPSPPPATVIPLATVLLQQGTIIPSFAQFAVTGEDNLQIVTVGAIAGATVQVQGRFLDAVQGKVLPFSFAVPLSSNRTVTTQLQALGTGYLLNLTAFLSGVSSARMGQAFVIVQMIRGLGGATTLLGTLVAGYVTVTQALGFPGSPIRGSLDGEPNLRQIIGTTPALGAGITETVPTGARWELLSWWVSVSNAGGIAAFTPVLSLTDPSGNTLAEMLAQFTTAAVATSTDFSWLGGYTPGGVTTTLIDSASLPVGIKLLAGAQIKQTAPPAGDQYTAPRYTVREWLEVG